ncbi:hypothetical protein [Micromonospora cathayae]|uniref:Uncharacterized protein n=1 Tax=Micromonospora cathayae TaxID=3028804 RepID=A0ABY7ZVQ0_9ACTN|nr:hypothetical protein [Micromonospora sp. HUAS 3]WDZ86553.1 hypothetical protein PVK37_09220 [Micromonospora sp. HUAS 3]
MSEIGEDGVTSVTRHWLFGRLYLPGGASLALPAALPRLVRRVHLADPGGCCFFDRVRTPAGPALEVWAHSTPPVLDDVEALLRTDPAWPLGSSTVRDVTRPVHHRHDTGRDVTDELAAASSRLALDLTDGDGLDPARHVDVTTTHLRGLTDLIPVADRRSFLFVCWQQWSSELQAGQRIELSVAAERSVPAPADGPVSAADAAAGPAWQAYLDRTAGIVRGQRDAAGPPPAYLVFSQAEATHDRLGIPVDLAALVALRLRQQLREPVDA